MIGASVPGGVFGILLLLTGSLLPGQFLHTVLDLLALGKFANQPELSEHAPRGTNAQGGSEDARSKLRLRGFVYSSPTCEAL
jgi:hypothetical protein